MLGEAVVTWKERDCIREPEETLPGLAGKGMGLGRGSAGAAALGSASFWC